MRLGSNIPGAAAGFLTAVLACTILAASAQAARSPFFGVVPQGRLSPSEYRRVADVAGTIRIPVFWYEAEPRQGEYDFSALDHVVGSAAANGVRVLPFIYGSPSWLAERPSRPPLDSPSARAAWTAFLERLVDRYGPGGDFWAGGGRALPIRRWQVWNEPNFGLFWSPRPSPPEYAELLRIAAAAIRGRDPQARILLGGVAPIAGAPRPWVYLRDLLDVPGVWRNFDVVTIHPYAGSLLSMAYQIEQARFAIAASGDRHTPIQVTEFGVASSGDRSSPMVMTAKGQAVFLRRAFRMLIENKRRWRIAGADWYTWRDSGVDDPSCVFCQGAGLLTQAGKLKPAWSAMRRISTGGSGA